MRHLGRWIALVAALLLVAAVGGLAYNAGVAHGIEQSGKIVTAPGGPYPYPYPYYGWHRPWGFGFFFMPLLFIAFWLLIVRGLFWRRAGYWRGACGHAFDSGRRLDEWHRRAHERMGESQLGDLSSGETAPR